MEIEKKDLKPVASELMRIYETEGALTPPMVVAAARSKDSPIHGYFEWDDKKAGAEYRLWQARELVLRVKIQVQASPKSTPQMIRLFHSVVDADEERSYQPIRVVMADKVLKASAMNQALTWMNHFERKFRQYQELQPIIHAIKQVKETLGKFSHHVPVATIRKPGVHPRP